MNSERLQEFALAAIAHGNDALAANVLGPLEAKRAMALRNRLIVLLTERVGAVRSAARYVFRGHPAIVREAMSLYERHRRAASERRANAKKAEPQKPS